MGFSCQTWRENKPFTPYKVQNLNNHVQDLSGNVSNLDDQISGLSAQFADNTTDVTGGYDPTSGDTVETTGLE